VGLQDLAGRNVSTRRGGDLDVVAGLRIAPLPRRLSRKVKFPKPEI